MSGSPKHCRATLSAAQEAQLRRAREEQARQEAERRRLEEERRRKERLEAARTEAGRGVEQAATRAQDLRSAEAARFVATELGEATAQLEGHRRQLLSAGDETTVRRLAEEADRVQENLGRLAAKAEACLLAERLDKGEAAVVVMRKQIDALPAHSSLRFDSPGHDACRKEITAAEAALRRKQPAEAEAALKRAQEAFRKHVAEVDRKRQELRAGQERVRSIVAAASDAVAGLAADPVVVRWSQPALTTLERRVDGLETMLNADQLEAAAREAAAITTEVASLIASSQQAQLDQDRRDYIVRGIAEVMSGLGFQIADGYPRLEYENDEKSAVVIQSERPGGQPLAVSVPLQGEIWYVVDDESIHVARTADGRAVTICDEAVDQIEALHAELDRACGIRMSRLEWNDEDPALIDAVRMQLPEATSTEAERSAYADGD
ncbi:MAG: hypothetical protein IT428_18790 [Planctomycetaceae bacterium]|nr:hypothetical protein [Planctomycetaceae bacterium]